MYKNRGFSLIELMIVVAIVGILAAVAIPSYQSSVEEGRRAEGVALAMDVAARQERYYTQNASYTADLGGSGLNMAQNTSESGDYKASVTIDSTGATYVIKVEPVDWTDSSCGDLTLKNTGERGVTKSGASVADCWQ